jgi:hypothetical protein
VSRLWDRLLPVAWPTRLTAVWPWDEATLQHFRPRYVTGMNPAASWGEYERLREGDHVSFEALVAIEGRRAKEAAMASGDCQCPDPNPDCRHPTCPREWWNDPERLREEQ